MLATPSRWYSGQPMALAAATTTTAPTAPRQSRQDWKRSVVGRSDADRVVIMIVRFYPRNGLLCTLTEQKAQSRAFVAERDGLGRATEGLQLISAAHVGGGGGLARVDPQRLAVKLSRQLCVPLR